MEPHEVTLSDVHIQCPHHISLHIKSCEDYEVVNTRFVYAVMQNNSSSLSMQNVCEDKDGDLEVIRRARPEFEVINLEHTLSTRLPDVGLQVWLGCLLLCDYILEHSERFADHDIIELGGGTGLASIIAGSVSGRVICTDRGEQILQMCQKNISLNEMVWNWNKGVINVKELDWCEKRLPTGDGSFCWSEHDLAAYRAVDIIIAADVVYDNDLTDAFFMTLYHMLCEKPGRTAFIALEKRLNFTLEEMDVSCKAYDHFQHCLTEISILSEDDGIQFSVQQIPTTFGQHFQYDRSKYLELWEISTTAGE